MGSRKTYAGNARFIEIGSAGIPFRFNINIDHIDSIRFEQIRGENEDGEIINTSQWGVQVLVAGQANQITFNTIEGAIACYNDILNMMRACGIPCITGEKLVAPKPPSPIVGPDGGKIAEAVDAALAHPELAGGEGIGVAGNDDSGQYVEDTEFELTDEDIEMIDDLTKPDHARERKPN